MHPNRPRIHLALAAALAALLSHGSIYAQAPREITAEILAAHGGDALPDQLTASGDIQVFGGFPGTFSLRFHRPARFRMDWDIGYAADVLSIDGGSAWQRGVSPRELSGLERQRMSRLPVVLRLRDLRDAGARLRFDPSARDELGNWLLSLQEADGRVVHIHVDPERHLIVGETRTEPYEEGPTPVTILYSDYRDAGGVMLPYEWDWSRPDMPMHLFVKRYELETRISDADFAYPHQADMAGVPYELSLSTMPHRVYKEDDGHLLIGGWYRGWGTPYAPTESWLFHAVVNEKYGRWVEPVRAVLTLYSGEDTLRTIELSKAVLEGKRSYPVARFNSIPEIYNFRHAMHEVRSALADRLRYRFEGTTPTGEVVAAEMDVALSRYELKHRYIFPLKGKFIIPNAHDYDMLFHTYERSQHFAYDILALGPDFELAKNGGATSADFFSFRKTEIIAPADGTVVYARNDVPDVATSAQYLRTVPDPMQAIGGNLMIIDHGEGEYSLLAHMAQGTVRVGVGDRVEQGQVLGLLGSAGSGDGLPHLHYQLQAGPRTFASDPLPVLFDNVSLTGFFKEDGATVLSPGVPYEAR